MGLLVDIRENWSSWLLNTQTVGANQPGPAVYFGTAPAIPIYTEKLKTINQAITDAKLLIGLHVVIVTAIARSAQNQVPGLYFDNIRVVARVHENPKVNKTGVCASDCAEAIAYFTRFFKFSERSAMTLQDVVLAAVQDGIAYDVIYKISAGITSAPVRPAPSNP